jgi:anti-sigma regulatory factor (Ser/Thr protein kinase)
MTVRTEEDVGALRRAVGALADRCHGLRTGEAALVATELATNIVRHSKGGGYVLYRQAAGGIELLAVDRGPGMRNVGAAGRTLLALPPSSPGPQPPGGLGVGLAGVQRLATVFDLFSNPSSGTVVLAQLLPAGKPPRWYRYGAINVGVDGSEVSGDAWAVAANGALAAVVVDGLGHGPEAAKASAAALSVLGPEVGDDPSRYLYRAHAAMAGTRGGMITLGAVDPGRGELRWTGIGNVTMKILTGGRSRQLVSRDGSIGTTTKAPRTTVEVEPWKPGDRVVLASDGLRTHWDIGAYPGLLDHHPAVVAATLMRDNERGTDDVTVLVVEDLRREGS